MSYIYPTYDAFHVLIYILETLKSGAYIKLQHIM